MDPVDANRMVCDCVVGSDRGICYPSGQFRWGYMTWVTCSDAHFAGEVAMAHGKEPHRSQRARMCLLSSRPRRATVSGAYDQLRFDGRSSCVQADDGSRGLRSAGQY